MDQFQKEQNELLEYMIKNVYFNRFDKTKNNNKTQIPGIEFYITSICNQKCSYCYLVKYGDKLYPKEIRDKDTIIRNMERVFEYLLAQGITYVPRVDLFSGEIWGMEFGNKILDTIIKYLEQGIQIDEIMIPTNASFITDDRIAEVIDYYHKRFKSLDVTFRMSASIDGAVVEHANRPFRKKDATEQLKTDEYYDKIMKFFFEHEWGFHPMIDASTIELQPENYSWWHEQFNKFGHTTYEQFLNYTMFLEVRNDSWTEDKLKSYAKWLNHMLDYDYKNYWVGHEHEFYTTLLCSDRNQNLVDYTNSVLPKNFVFGYLPTMVSPANSKSFGCSAGNLLSIRLGDLSIVPCHRTSYPKFIYGKFDVTDDKITGVTANNPFLMFNILGQGTTTQFKCDTCPINSCCMHGCLGSQWENTNDIFYPVKSVCDLNKVKVIFMAAKAAQFSKLHDLDTTGVSNYSEALAKKLKEKEPEETEKWQTIITNEILI